VGFANNPIYYSDPSGLNPGGPDEDGGRKTKDQQSTECNGATYQLGDITDGSWELDEVVVASTTCDADGAVIADVGDVTYNNPDPGTDDHSSSYEEIPPDNSTARKATDELQGKTNSELQSIMWWEIKLLGDKDVYQSVKTRFEENTGLKNVVNVPISEFPNGPSWNSLINNIRTGLSNQLAQTNGDITKVWLNAYINPINFGGKPNMLFDPSYASVLGDTRQIEIICHNVTYVKVIPSSDPSTNPNLSFTYTADIEIVVLDRFGVSESDVYDDNAATEFPGGRRTLAAYWVLQHQRGYQSFINEFHFRLNITGIHFGSY